MKNDLPKLSDRFVLLCGDVEPLAVLHILLKPFLCTEFDMGQFSKRSRKNRLTFKPLNKCRT
jgi:hypothetical protein